MLVYLLIVYMHQQIIHAEDRRYGRIRLLKSVSTNMHVSTALQGLSQVHPVNSSILSITFSVQSMKLSICSRISC